MRARLAWKLKTSPEKDILATLSTSANSPPILTPTVAGNELTGKDEFIQETLVSLEDTLVEAVEKVISLDNTETSKTNSSCSSRSTSKRRERRDSTSTQSDVRSGHGHGHGQGLNTPQEVPRSQCKTVVLSALEEIIREVIEEREQEGHDDGNAPAAAAREEIKTNPTRNLHHNQDYVFRDAAAREEGGSTLREAVRRWLDSVEVSD